MTTTPSSTPPKASPSAEPSAGPSAEPSAEPSADPSALTSVEVVRWTSDVGLVRVEDVVVAEAPLEIVLQAGARSEVFSVTMRTPGDDLALVLGLLLAERVLTAPQALADLHTCLHHPNRVRARLKAQAWPELLGNRRNTPVSASCGLCGKTSVEAVLGAEPFPGLDPAHPTLDPAWLASLPARARRAQRLFDQTGGLHAAALFDVASGDLVDLREDIGRHNAVDKLLGAQALAGHWPLRDRVLVLSGRVSFELIQKAGVACIPAVVAVGAPSGLAVEMARRACMTLVGFTRPDRMNVYAGEARVLERGRVLLGERIDVNEEAL